MIDTIDHDPNEPPIDRGPGPWRWVFPVIVAAASLSFSARFAAADTYFCATEAAGGLKYVNGAWRGVGFATGGDQFTVSQVEETTEYVVRTMGSSSTLLRCTRKSYNGTINSQMTCGGLGLGLIFDFDTLRFTQLHSWGYIEDDQSGENTPYVSGGKCTVIQ